MKPEAQRVAIAEARGWGFKTQPKPVLTHTKPIRGSFLKAFKRPTQKSWQNEMLSEGNSNRGFQESYQVSWEDVFRLVPDYLNDRNAMDDALKSLSYEQQPVYLHILKYEVLMKPEGVSEWDMHVATAAERAEAFLRTISKWVNSETE